jgi:hypothetical protein
VTEPETTMLAARLHRLADEQTPTVDVVAQVRAARERHRRQRRARVAVLAVATAATALVAGTAVTVNVLSADRGREVAGPGTPTGTPTPSTAALPAGWEARTFQGVDFAVPPGARSEDTFLDVPVSSWTSGPTLIWNGPQLTADAYSSVSVMIADPFQGGLPPRGGGRSFTVPGAEKAYGNIETTTMTDGLGSAERVVVWLELLADDHLVQVDAMFDGGDAGQRMAEQLIDSISLTSTIGPPSTDQALADERLGNARLAAGVEALRAALQARPRSLTAPADLTTCPQDTGAVSAALGVPLDYVGGSLPGDPGACEWSSGTSAGNPADVISVSIGFAAGWTMEDVDAITPGQGCRRDFLPMYTPAAVLDSCPLQGTSTQWSLYVPDSEGAGIWMFTAFQGGNQPVDGAAALAAALDVAASTW